MPLACDHQSKQIWWPTCNNIKMLHSDLIHLCQQLHPLQSCTRRRNLWLHVYVIFLELSRTLSSPRIYLSWWHNYFFQALYLSLKIVKWLLSLNIVTVIKELESTLDTVHANILRSGFFHSMKSNCTSWEKCTCHIVMHSRSN